MSIAFEERHCPVCQKRVQVDVDQPSGKVIHFFHEDPGCAFLIFDRTLQLKKLEDAQSWDRK